MSVFAPPRLRPKHFLRVTFLDGAGNVIDTDAAAAAHHINGLASMQSLVDLTRYRECRLVGTRRATAGAAGYTVELKYATSYTAAAGSFSQLGTSAVSVNATTASTTINTGWFAITPAARIASVIVQVIATGGDGAADPNWGVLAAEFR